MNESWPKHGDEFVKNGEVYRLTRRFLSESRKNDSSVCVTEVYEKVGMAGGEKEAKIEALKSIGNVAAEVVKNALSQGRVYDCSKPCQQSFGVTPGHEGEYLESLCRHCNSRNTCWKPECSNQR